MVLVELLLEQSLDHSAGTGHFSIESSFEIVLRMVDNFSCVCQLSRKIHIEVKSNDEFEVGEIFVEKKE